jgi:hypothetical protein
MGFIDHLHHLESHVITAPSQISTLQITAEPAKPFSACCLHQPFLSSGPLVTAARVELFANCQLSTDSLTNQLLHFIQLNGTQPAWDPRYSLRADPTENTLFPL